MGRTVKVFIPTGGLFLIDVIFKYAGMYELSAFVSVPMQTLTHVGAASLCAWAFVSTGKVKKQLVEKFPHGIGRLLIRWT